MQFKINSKFILPVIGLAMTLAVACTHDPVIPDLPEISFSERVQPIIVANCGSSGCHDGGEEFSLLTYDEIADKVKPGDAGDSEIYEAMTALWGESAMPPAGPLSDQQINIIYTWIMQGAKNN
jgi:hypothetical protein